MIAREDLELKMKAVAAELEKDRNRMYHALDVLPVKDFEARDALNHEIAASIGEQRAWRKMWEWVSENYRPESERNFTEGPSPLNGRSRAEEMADFGPYQTEMNREFDSDGRLA